MAAVLDAGLRLEAAGWKGDEGGAVLSRPSYERWYRSIAEIAHQNGWLRLSTLHLDERMIAFTYDLVYGGRRYGMLSAYDASPDVSRLSAGTILLDRMLQRSVEEGLTTYEFGHGSTAWKRNWTSTEHTIYDISVYGAGLAGRSAFRIRRLRSRETHTPSTT
jgi:CelD/BcsL family acetyltransferase involved in cellulose biosynthesis